MALEPVPPALFWLLLSPEVAHWIPRALNNCIRQVRYEFFVSCMQVIWNWEAIRSFRVSCFAFLARLPAFQLTKV